MISRIFLNKSMHYLSSSLFFFSFANNAAYTSIPLTSKGSEQCAFGNKIETLDESYLILPLQLILPQNYFILH